MSDGAPATGAALAAAPIAAAAGATSDDEAASVLTTLKLESAHTISSLAATFTAISDALQARDAVGAAAAMAGASSRGDASATAARDEALAALTARLDALEQRLAAGAAPTPTASPASGDGAAPAAVPSAAGTGAAVDQARIEAAVRDALAEQRGDLVASAMQAATAAARAAVDGATSPRGGGVSASTAAADDADSGDNAGPSGANGDIAATIAAMEARLRARIDETAAATEERLERYERAAVERTERLHKCEQRAEKQSVVLGKLLEMIQSERSSAVGDDKVAGGDGGGGGTLVVQHEHSHVHSLDSFVVSEREAQAREMRERQERLERRAGDTDDALARLRKELVAARRDISDAEARVDERVDAAVAAAADAATAAAAVADSVPVAAAPASSSGSIPATDDADVIRAPSSADTLLKRKMNAKVLGMERRLNELQVLVKKLTVSSQVNDQRLRTLRDETATRWDGVSDDIVVLRKAYDALCEQFNAQSTVLDAQLANYRTEAERSAAALTESIQRAEEVLEKKADLSLVLDKVSRDEFEGQIERLFRSADDLAIKSVGREEYDEKIAELRELAFASDQDRNAQLQQLSNEMQALTTSIAAKAAKSEVLALTTSVDELPERQRAAVEELRVMLLEEITLKTSTIVELSDAQREMRRVIRKLVNTMNVEVLSRKGSEGHTAALRASVTEPLACLSCSTRLLREQQRLAQAHAAGGHEGTAGAASATNTNFLTYGDPDAMLPASRGGGFMLANPRVTYPVPATGIDVGEILTQSAVRLQTQEAAPNSSAPADAPEDPAGANSDDDGLGTLLNDEPDAEARGEAGTRLPTIRPTKPEDPELPGRMLGTDGRYYGHAGARTHRPVRKGGTNPLIQGRAVTRRS